MNIEQIFKENRLNDVILINESSEFYSKLPNSWQKIVVENNFEEKQKVIS